ncbi:MULTISPECIES: 50S ribosomal protein L6 [unclassified Neptuniibacter]|uniref:50S ribosomal protein L6 n=1 Tax=unclassified Neptuniibacter TaxID=2630693 RepID=UPI0025F87B31|nr:MULTISPECIES: 50S ribosomal protein L6 [unclassified Neptuniibacter]|tara:strand:- start:16198 stop:16731 length:534 start_codon:yes stop_codon:yes gene_type:complete
MSRIAKSPVVVPAGVEVKIDGQSVNVKGKNGQLSMDAHSSVSVVLEEDGVKFAPLENSKLSLALSGTTRSLVNNMVIGVSEGFKKTLELQGVGYRAAAKGKVLNLSLGFSHPIDYELPEGISAETPNVTTVILSGADKQTLGQVAAEIRAFRPPEPYKGKGVRYADEYVRRKEAKKK